MTGGNKSRIHTLNIAYPAAVSNNTSILAAAQLLYEVKNSLTGEPSRFSFRQRHHAPAPNAAEAHAARERATGNGWVARSVQTISRDTRRDLIILFIF